MKIVEVVEKDNSLEIKTEAVEDLNANASFDEIQTELDDDSLESFCKQLDFLVKSSDSKAKTLYQTFREGWKDKFKDIEVTSGFVNIRELHPTQNVIYAKKSLKLILNGEWKMKGHDLAVDALLGEDEPKIEMGDPIVVCKVKGVNWLIDGHHRWSKAYAFNPNSSMKAYIIKQAFKSSESVLKFAQGTLTALNNKSPINDAQPANDFNMYNMTPNQLKSIVNDNLTDEVLEHIKKAEVTDEAVDDKKTLITYLWGNIRIMRKYAPKGKHDREYMPQFPDGDTNPANAVKKIKD